MSPAERRAAQIAALNDRLRRRTPIRMGNLGQTLCTSGFINLAPQEQADLIEHIRTYDRFDASNDPYGEHDFGALPRQDGGQVFWKIDYYADASCTAGAEDPTDADQSYRILTIMLAEEY